MVMEYLKNLNNDSVDNSLVGVVVPIYNVAKYLARCLDTILSQEYQNWLCVLVNDGSTDSSADIIDRYCEKDARFVKYTKKNGGLPAARHSGAKEAIRNNVDWLVFVDSDDTIDSNYISHMLNVAETESADIVWSGARKLRENGEIIETSDSHYSVLNLLENGGLTTALKAVVFVPQPEIAIHPSVCESLYSIHLFEDIDWSFNEGMLMEDARLQFQLVSRAKKLVNTDVVSYNYYQYETSSLHSVKYYGLDMIESLNRLFIEKIAEIRQLTDVSDEKKPLLTNVLNQLRFRVNLHILNYLVDYESNTQQNSTACVDAIKGHMKPFLKNDATDSYYTHNKKGLVTILVLKYLGFSAYKLVRKLTKLLGYTVDKTAV
jgi:glycosyltransferase involved in cell wall biosynthesis